MSVIDKIHMLKKMVKEAENIVAWQEAIYTELNTLAGRFKADSVTDTTGADGKISVSFVAPFTSTPVVTVQLENDVDYYPVVTAKSTTGFTVKMLKTYHKHSQGATGGESSHTHGISFASGVGSAHRHSNPNTSSVSAGTPSGSISGQSAGTPSGDVGNESSHTHPGGGATGEPSATVFRNSPAVLNTDYCAETSGGPVTKSFYSIQSYLGTNIPSSTHTHNAPTTGAGSSHSHSFSGDSLPAHGHTFSGSPLGTHSHTIGNTGYESAHTHSVSGTSGAGSSHSHSNPDTAEVNAGNTLASTEVTFSYIAMVP